MQIVKALPYYSLISCTFTAKHVGRDLHINMQRVHKIEIKKHTLLHVLFRVRSFPLQMLRGII